MSISQSKSTAQKITQKTLLRIRGRTSDEFMPQVAIYTTAMIRELDANLYKGDYRQYSAQELAQDAATHLDKFKESLEKDEKTRSLEYAADVGNLMFMAADRANVLNESVLMEREKEPDFVTPTTKITHNILRPYSWLFRDILGELIPVFLFICAHSGPETPLRKR